MGIVCPSCDAEPSSDQTAGGPCPVCGTRLVVVDRSDDLIGTIIDDRFEVLGRLGAGGMGVVYRARQRSIDREIALKVLDRHVEHDVTSVKRFFREAKLASSLAHPNTVQIIDFGQSADRRLYLAMELVRGHDLSEETRRVGALPLPRVIKIVTQLCDALEVAHGLSIVHRDLKPENVMLLDGGADFVKILDFGLARSTTDPTSRATATGTISGTPRFMAPVVAMEGAEPAPSQDMYAVGVILAELSLGRALWEAPTLAALFTQKLDALDVTAAVPAALRPLVRALLHATPSARPTAAETRAALARITTDAPGDAPASPSTAELSLGALDNPRLVSLADVTAPAPPSPSRSALATGPTIPPPFAPPAAEDPPLELDPTWRPERAAAAVTTTHAPVTGGRPAPVRRGSSPLLGVLAIALVAGGVGAYYKLRDQPAASHPAKDLSKGVEIVITSSEPVVVEIDGHKAGKTPLRLTRARGDRPILITAPGGTPVQVVPDHDQTIDLTPK